LFPTGRFFADSTTTRLSFEMIEIDRSFLSDTLAQLPEIVDAFPVRGDITADSAPRTQPGLCPASARRGSARSGHPQVGNSHDRDCPT
jgi:hypothetical protein